MTDKLDARVAKIITDNEVIGRRKYMKLKSFDYDKMDTDDMVEFRKLNNISVAEAERQILAYEEKWNKPINNKKISEYFDKLSKMVEQKPIIMTKEWLWKEFLLAFKQNEKVNFIKNENSIENIKPIFFYFLGDLESMRKCKTVSKLSELSLNKGLLVIGDYGNGKTSLFKALERAFKPTNYIFKGYGANEVVTMYEGCKSSTEKEELMRIMTGGIRYYDDIRTERVASNYGKVELFKDILEIRYNKKKITYITCNYSDDYPQDLEKALEALGEKYGFRLYDRLFEMFNIIEFKGSSFRK